MDLVVLQVILLFSCITINGLHLKILLNRFRKNVVFIARALPPAFLIMISISIVPIEIYQMNNPEENGMSRFNWFLGMSEVFQISAFLGLNLLLVITVLRSYMCTGNASVYISKCSIGIPACFVVLNSIGVACISALVEKINLNHTVCCNTTFRTNLMMEILFYHVCELLPTIIVYIAIVIYAFRRYQQSSLQKELRTRQMKVKSSTQKQFIEIWKSVKIFMISFFIAWIPFVALKVYFDNRFDPLYQFVIHSAKMTLFLTNPIANKMLQKNNRKEVKMTLKNTLATVKTWFSKSINRNNEKKQLRNITIPTITLNGISGVESREVAEKREIFAEKNENPENPNKTPLRPSLKFVSLSSFDSLNQLSLESSFDKRCFSKISLGTSAENVALGSEMLNESGKIKSGSALTSKNRLGIQNQLLNPPEHFRKLSRSLSVNSRSARKIKKILSRSSSSSDQNWEPESEHLVDSEYLSGAEYDNCLTGKCVSNYDSIAEVKDVNTATQSYQPYSNKKVARVRPRPKLTKGVSFDLSFGPSTSIDSVEKPESSIVKKKKELSHSYCGLDKPNEAETLLIQSQLYGNRPNRNQIGSELRNENSFSIKKHPLTSDSIAHMGCGLIDDVPEVHVHNPNRFQPCSNKSGARLRPRPKLIKGASFDLAFSPSTSFDSVEQSDSCILKNKITLRHSCSGMNKAVDTETETLLNKNRLSGKRCKNRSEVNDDHSTWSQSCLNRNVARLRPHPKLTNTISFDVTYSPNVSFDSLCSLYQRSCSSNSYTYDSSSENW